MMPRLRICNIHSVQEHEALVKTPATDRYVCLSSVGAAGSRLYARGKCEKIRECLHRREVQRGWINGMDGIETLRKVRHGPIPRHKHRINGVLHHRIRVAALRECPLPKGEQRVGHRQHADAYRFSKRRKDGVPRPNPSLETPCVLTLKSRKYSHGK